ncbi:MAG: pyroglutamyl-peptidase [Herbinix sp.]|jgi:pyroglutamyl-peptidase|nr:pyroglutamyl-peptidase [Herbinix sp.]
MRILVTAFEPFGGETINPALEAVTLMKDEIAGAAISKLTVPTVFHKSIEKVYTAMNELRPDAVLCIGQAGGRYDITPERIAINIDDARIQDNESNQPLDQPIFPKGPAAYFSNLPVKAIVKTICDHGLPSSLSNSAGTFVCNHLMYGVLYYIEKEFPNMRGGFIHVPYIPCQVIGRSATTPSMALTDIVHGLELAVQAIAENHTDISLVYGTIH